MTTAPAFVASPSMQRPDAPTTLSRDGSTRTVRWGLTYHLGSPAYWVERCRLDVLPDHRHALGDSLAEEVAACILGGHGIPAEVGLEAYRILRARGLLSSAASATGGELEAVLREPLDMGGGRTIRYRFAAQRGHRVAEALSMLRASNPPKDPVGLRTWLLELPGVGPKTASWVVRNHLGSDQVAIIDVHVLRAGVIAGVFDSTWTPARDYFRLEAIFLAWAEYGGVSAADLDAMIWWEMSRLGRNVYTALGAPEGGGSWYSIP